jgi:hypothetical protein
MYLNGELPSSAVVVNKTMATGFFMGKEFFPSLILFSVSALRF